MVYVPEKTNVQKKIYSCWILKIIRKFNKFDNEVSSIHQILFSALWSSKNFFLILKKKFFLYTVYMELHNS